MKKDFLYKASKANIELKTLTLIYKNLSWRYFFHKISLKLYIWKLTPSMADEALIDAATRAIKQLGEEDERVSKARN